MMSLDEGNDVMGTGEENDITGGDVTSCGFLNHAINALPIELHISEYQFLSRYAFRKELARGDQDINLLDAACRDHDITYSRSKDLTKRHITDKILAEEARKWITAKNSTLGDYELTDFETYHTISNVNSSNNKFYFDEDDKEIVIPEKRVILQFHPSNIAKEETLRKEDEEYPLTIHANNNTMKSEIKCAYRVNFIKSYNIV
ncbi:hypothetical protein ALC53_07192 [Atta colombica]|uniref:Uncharacterized protein n=1 Tax=Atta colombica TaxID=520822 RepID=A0A195BDW4_9HYME|nr:hypothetical protein ALC53_07192 [Atta colombica]